MANKNKKSIDQDLIDRVIRGSQICHLSCCLEHQPYLVPISFGYDGQAIYIHTSQTGKKIAIFEKNPRVCLSFVAHAALAPDSDQACKFSFESSSVIAEGRIQEITITEEKIASLNQIMAHYSDQEWAYPEESVAKTRTWKIILENPTARISPDPAS